MHGEILTVSCMLQLNRQSSNHTSSVPTVKPATVSRVAVPSLEWHIVGEDIRGMNAA